MSEVNRWRPSIHMPRWASRILLEVTNVRVERVQDISEADALAEGSPAPHGNWKQIAPGGLYTNGYGVAWKGYRSEFQILWDSINAKRGYGWDSNPWVWVVSFKPVKPDNADKG